MNANYFFRSILTLICIVTAFITVAQDVELRSQADVDAFDPSTTQVLGTLLVGEQGMGVSDIVDISNLSNIQRVFGDLIISRNVNLLNVDELSSITRIGGYLSVTTNQNLTNIDGLSNLVRMGFREDLIVYENTRLENVDGLSNLSAHVDILRIYNNFSLTNLDGLNKLVTIQSIEIEDNVGLVNVRGFDSLTNIETTAYIRRNGNLLDVSGFDNLNSVGAFIISDNSSLTDVDIFTQKDTLFGSVSFFRNDALLNIDGFDSLRHVTGTLEISSNKKLLSIKGIEKVETVGGNLSVTRSRLTDLDALSNLQSVGGLFRILSNSILDNCCAIRELVKNSDTTIGDTLFIDSNYCGCTSVEEVKQNSCGLRMNAITSPPCLGEQNGSIQIYTRKYDMLPFSYSWIRQEDNAMGSGISDVDVFSINELAVGTYDITVTTPYPDTVVKLDVVLSEVDGSFFEVIEVNSGNSSNGLSNGSIEITTTGGVEPYAYQWSGTSSGVATQIVQPTYTIGGLKYGEYRIEILDSEGASAQIDVTLLDDEVEVIICDEPLDIVILNDVSTSVDASEYRQSQKFFVDFLQELNIGNDVNDSRGSIVEWSSISKLVIPLTGDLSILESYIFSNRSFEGSTFAHQAMTFAQSYLDANAREDVAKVVVLATDGANSQIPSSLIDLADQMKADGYHIITIAFDQSFKSSETREKLRQIASLGSLAPGAESYNDLDEGLANDIVSVYLCPVDVGSFASAYFTLDGEIEITNIVLEGDCPDPNFVQVTIDLNAYRELSIPAGMPITFYHNNPNQSGATNILTWYVPCVILAGTSETFTVTLPIDGPTNLFAVLNDDGVLNPPINFPITNIEEIAYANNIDNERICGNGTATVQAFKYSSLPVPGCDTIVNYTVNVCNVSGVDAFGINVTDIAPVDFELVSSLFNDNDCAIDIGGTYDLPADCCFTLLLTYDAASAANGYYGNQGVTLDGPDTQTYIDFDGSTTTEEDVTLDGEIDCPSVIIEFTKSVNLDETCDDGYVEFTFTINNEMNIPLQGLTFTDILPDPCTWVFMPYGESGLIIGDVDLVGSEAVFTIVEVAANTIATFHMDANLNSWDSDGILNNMATLDNVPDILNGGFTTLVSNSTSTQVTAAPKITLPDTILVSIGTDTIGIDILLSTAAELFWTAEGDGEFIDSNAMNAMYVVGVQDSVDGEVLLFVSAISDCNESGASVVIQFVECDIQVELVDIGMCDDMGTPLDGSDDTYDVTVVVSENNAGPNSMFVISNNNYVDTLPYNLEHIISFPISGTIDTLTFSDLEIGYCFNEIEVFQEDCAVECTEIDDIELVLNDCNDNGTPQDSTDDYYIVEFTVLANNPITDSTFTTMYNGQTVGPFLYGELAQLSLSADSVVDSILVQYSNFDYCSLWVIANQADCFVEEECLEVLSSLSIEETVISDCENFSANLTASTNLVDGTNLNYIWTNFDGEIIGEDTTLAVETIGDYILTVSYCDEILSDSISLTSSPSEALKWPKVFFPNGMEEENKTFGPYIECEALVTDYSLTIYNRWGNEVFTSDDIEYEWDGQHHGEESPTAVYVYVAQYTINGKKQPLQKGDVTLLRN